MSRASFLDRSPEASLDSAFAIWIRWWLKRKLKRNPLSFSVAVPRLAFAVINFPPSDSCLGVKPCNRVARTLPNECPSREWSPHRNASNFRGKQHRHWSISCSSLPLARALRPSHGSCRYFGEQRRFVSHRGKPHFTPIFCLARRTNCTHSAMAGDDGFLIRLSLSPRPVRHLSKTNVN